MCFVLYVQPVLNPKSYDGIMWLGGLVGNGRRVTIYAGRMKDGKV